MLVLPVAWTLAATELVIEQTATVLKGVDNVLLLEERQHTEDAGFVHRTKCQLQIRQRYRVLLATQCLQHKYAIGGGLDPFLLKVTLDVLIHITRGSRG